MQKQMKEIWRVVISSPSDVEPERRAVSSVVEEVNRGLDAGQFQVQLDVRQWEKHVPAGIHPMGAQGLVEEYLSIPDAHILIGIFRNRLGSASIGGQTGSEREVFLAYEAWESKGSPSIMLYFDEGAPSPKTVEEAEQKRSLLEFKLACKQKGMLVREYDTDPSTAREGDTRSFEFHLRNDLMQYSLKKAAKERLLKSGDITCQALVVPALARQEGLTELAGDIRLWFPELEKTFHGHFDIQLWFNTEITGFQEARLIFDDDSEPLRGDLAGPGSIFFRAVPLRPSSNGQRTLLVRDVRLNATRFLATREGGVPIFGTVAVNGKRKVLVMNPQFPVALIFRGVVFRLRSQGDGWYEPLQVYRETGVNPNLDEDAPTWPDSISSFHVQFREDTPVRSRRKYKKEQGQPAAHVFRRSFNISPIMCAYTQPPET
jgi:hypothetical protein